jgi:DNA-binding transcriptional LysR family regulator
MSRIGDRGELEALVRSVELGSLSAAARERGLTPSTLSKLVTRLEQALEVRLVTRTTRRIVPTPEGELFIARCRRILAEMEDAEMEVGRSRERPRGRLRMHVGVGFAMHQLVDALPKFLKLCPEVQVDLLFEDRRVDLSRENIDISVRPWQPDITTLVVRKIFDFERIVCAAPSYLRRRGSPRTPDDLLRHRCLTTSSIPNHAHWLFRGTPAPRLVDVNPTVSVNNSDAVYRFVLAGQGIARLNEFIVAGALREGRLVRVLEGWQAPEHLSMLAIYPQERHRLPRVAAMLDFLQDTFAARPWLRAQRARR